MKLNLNVNLPQVNSPTFISQLYVLFRAIAVQVNNLSDGLLTASYSSATAPTTGTHALGDYCKNSSPTELGTTGSKYIIVGWICTAEGTPGTWQESRTLTGN